MFRLGRAFWHRLRSSPRLTALVAIILLLALAAGGAYAWTDYHFRAATTAVKNQNYPVARRHVQSCLSVWPWSVPAHFLAARIERLDRHFAAAEEHLNECKRLRKGADEDIQLEWILLRAQRGELDEVLGGLRNGLDNNDPRSTLILETLASVYMENQRFHPARTYLDRWLEKEPTSAQALDWRGWVNERLALLENAAEDYERALQLAPDRVSARIRLVNLYLAKRTEEKVLPHLDYLRQHHPDVPEGFIGLAHYWYEKNDLSQARSQLDQALKLQPNHAEALLLRGQVELRADQPAAAETWLRKAQAEMPSDTRVAEALTRSLQAQGNKAEEAAIALGRYKALDNDTKRLNTLLLKDVEGNSTSPAIPYEVGKLFLRLGQEQFGLQWLDTALRRDPLHEATHQLLAEHFEKTNQPEQAQQHREALERIKAKAQATKTTSPRSGEK